MIYSMNRIVAAATLSIFVLTMLAGCGGGGMLGTVLKVTGATALLPEEWSSTGGLIKILAGVSGNGIKKVIAYIKKLGDDDPSPIVLRETEPGTFEGTFEADQNNSAAQSEEYSITVQAVDVAGNQASSEPVSVEVPPTDAVAARNH